MPELSRPSRPSGLTERKEERDAKKLQEFLSSNEPEVVTVVSNQMGGELIKQAEDRQRLGISLELAEQFARHIYSKRILSEDLKKRLEAIANDVALKLEAVSSTGPKLNSAREGARMITEAVRGFKPTRSPEQGNDKPTS